MFITLWLVGYTFIKILLVDLISNQNKLTITLVLGNSFLGMVTVKTNGKKLKAQVSTSQYFALK